MLPSILDSSGALELPRKKSSRDIERIFYTFAEAKEFLGVSHQTIYKLIKDGLPSHRIGRKRVFLKEDLVRWIKEH
jgi:excisionase family DNA binding protein